MMPPKLDYGTCSACGDPATRMDGDAWFHNGKACQYRNVPGPVVAKFVPRTP